MQKTYEEFVESEIQLCGVDYVEDLFDRGLEPTPLRASDGKIRWFWVAKVRTLESVINHR